MCPTEGAVASKFLQQPFVVYGSKGFWQVSQYFSAEGVAFDLIWYFTYKIY